MAGERKTGVKAAGTATPAVVVSSVRAQARTMERLDATVTASTSRLEQSLQGLAMRVELLESAMEDAVRALRELQTAVGGIPIGAGLEQVAAERRAGGQANTATAMLAVEHQIAALGSQVETLGNQMENLRRRIPLRARREAVSVQLDDAALAAIAQSIAKMLSE